MDSIVRILALSKSALTKESRSATNDFGPSTSASASGLSLIKEELLTLLDEVIANECKNTTAANHTSHYGADSDAL